MSVTIRLAKVGKRHAPSYKVVVSNTRDKRNGKFLEILGYYNPSKNPEELKIDEKLFKEWKGKGALVSDAVTKLMAGEYTYVKYDPNKKEEEPKDSTSEDSEEANEDSAVEETEEETSATEETEGNEETAE